MSSKSTRMGCISISFTSFGSREQCLETKMATVAAQHRTHASVSTVYPTCNLNQWGHHVTAAWSVPRLLVWTLQKCSSLRVSPKRSRERFKFAAVETRRRATQL